MKKTPFAQLQQRFLGLRGVEMMLAAGTACGLCALILVIADGILILPEPWRRGAFWWLVAALVFVVAIWLLLMWKASPLRLAYLFEQHNPHLGTALTNALQLGQGSRATAVAEVLRRQALAYGAVRAKEVRLWPLVRRRLIVLLTLGLLTGLLWGVGSWWFGSMFKAVLPRFLDPTGDHPPYSRLQIEVVPATYEVLFGGQCEIHATTRGAPVEQLQLVTDNAEGRTHTPMFRRPDHSYFFTLTNLRSDTRLWVTNGRARSQRHLLQVRTTPQITAVTVEVTFPDYTGLRPWNDDLPETDLRLPIASQVRLQVQSNRPLRAGTLQLTPLLGGTPQSLPMQQVPNSQTMVVGQFTLQQAVAFTLTVTDVDGLPSRISRKGRVTLRPDQPPQLFIEEPGLHAVATPQTQVPIRVRAEDDYGIRQLHWFRGLNRSIEVPIKLGLQGQEGASSVVATTVLRFMDLGVQPGDRLDYYFEAVDSDPNGPQIALSRVYRIDIISLQQYQEILRSRAAQRGLFEQYYRLASHLKRLREQAQILLQKRHQWAEAESPQTPPLQAETTHFRAAMETFEQHLERAAKASPSFDIEGAFQKHLFTNALGLSLLRDRYDTMLAKAGNAPFETEEMASITEGLRQLSGQIEKQLATPARQIAAVVQLLAKANEFVRMTQAQQELAQLARRFAKPKKDLSRLEQMELREIEALQAKVDADLQQFLAQVPELMAALPNGEKFAQLQQSTAGFLAAVRAAKIQTDLHQATAHYAQQDGPQGHRLSAMAATKMDQLLRRLEKADLMTQARECLLFQPSIGQRLGHSLEQILGALRNQGVGGGEGEGYSLFNEQVGLYGPDLQIPGAGESSPGELASTGTSSHGETLVATQQKTTPLTSQQDSGRVRLQKNVQFPLRYRRLVGDYFKAIADSQKPRE